LFSIALRRLVFRVHLWTAVLSGLFFVVLAVSGSLLGFQEKIDRALHFRLYEVVPAPQYLPLSEILSSVRKAFPSDDVVAVTMPMSPRDSWSIALPSGIAYIDPYTGRVLGLRQRGTALVGVISQIHVSLACGRIGRTAVRWIDFAALVLMLSGIQLWWPVRRIGIRRRSFSGREASATRRFWVDVHNSAGALSFVILIILVATGAVLSCEGSVVWYWIDLVNMIVVRHLSTFNPWRARRMFPSTGLWRSGRLRYQEQDQRGCRCPPMEEPTRLR
jgi:uncharacterized iron-regulated membrane protein